MPNPSKIRLDVMGEQQERPTQSANDNLVQVNNIRLSEEDIISFKPAKNKKVELSFDKLILMGIGLIVLGFIFSSSSKPNSKYSEQQLMQIAQQLESDTNRLKEKEHELYLRELNLRVESERIQEKIDQAKRLYINTPSQPIYQTKEESRDIDIKIGTTIKGKASECKSWRNSQLIDPTPQKQKYIEDNCN